MATAAQPPTLALTWHSDRPIWVEQWPLTTDRLQQAQTLVQEQLQAGYIRPSTSPWNTPIFVIQKKSGKWRLLQDLRRVNDQMQAMGALQPGLPSPTMLPEHWSLLIIDLKDCFFTIPLADKDCQRFAFTVPAVNKQAPAKRYEWLVLPQGMKNSPTLCQLYVAWALEPIRAAWCDVIIYHYMDDILFCRPDCFQDSDLHFIQRTLEDKGLKIAPEKVQRKRPWLYLGWKISDSSIRPQKVEISTTLHNLTDVQTFLGNIQWVRRIVGITNDDLALLLPLLRGRRAEQSITLTNEQRQALSRISRKVADGAACRRIAKLPLSVIIVNHVSHPYAVIGQWQKEEGGNKGRQKQEQCESDATDPKSRNEITKIDNYERRMVGQQFRILEWIFLSIQPKMSIQTRTEAIAELVRKGRIRSIDISGQEPGDISLPITQDHLEWCLQQSTPLQEAVLGFPGLVHSRAPKGPLWQVIRSYKWRTVPQLSPRPVVGRTVYTDAGAVSKRAVCVWYESGTWENHLITGSTGDTLQTLELSAVVWACQRWMREPINIVSDSLYVVNVVNRIEDALIRQTKKDRLLSLFLQLRDAIQGRTAPYCVIHIRSHQFSIGLAEGNTQADKLVSIITTRPESDFMRARVSHEMFHQNAKGLRRMFGLTWAEARGIVRACPSCSHHGPGLGLGINPRGVKALEVWQMDVTHMPEFGTKRYVHVCIDTFSRFMWATAQGGEKALHVCRHLTVCFAIMGVPQQIKTDNGPAYVSKKISTFMKMWGVTHITGIPYSPTGQAIVERSHQVLKEQIARLKEIKDVDERLSKALFVLNHLCLTGDREDPPTSIHFQTLNKAAPNVLPQIKVSYRDPATGVWKGPVPVLFIGRGYFCVSTTAGPVWVPSRFVKAVQNVPTDGEITDEDSDIVSNACTRDRDQAKQKPMSARVDQHGILSPCLSRASPTPEE